MNDTPSSRAILPGYWFSQNPDKAWGEKFFLTFIPFWFVYNIVVQQMGWLDTGNFWNITQNLLMWLPYCVLLPWFLRRNSGIAWHRSYWFKFNVFMFWWIVLATYFHTEYFFEVLGMRYRFPEVTLYLDSALVGPDEATALARAHESAALDVLQRDRVLHRVPHQRRDPDAPHPHHDAVVGAARARTGMGGDRGRGVAVLGLGRNGVLLQARAQRLLERVVRGPRSHAGLRLVLLRPVLHRGLPDRLSPRRGRARASAGAWGAC